MQCHAGCTIGVINTFPKRVFTKLAIKGVHEAITFTFNLQSRASTGVFTFTQAKLCRILEGDEAHCTRYGLDTSDRAAGPEQEGDGEDEK